MILIWLIYIFISLLISILVRNLFQGFIKKRVFFSFIFSLLATSWFIYPGTQEVSPILSILIVEIIEGDSLNMMRLIRPFLFLFSILFFIDLILGRLKLKTKN